MPDEYKSLELDKVLFRITKNFLLNDFELLNFSIYFEKMAWDCKSIDPENFLFVLGLAVKIKLAKPNNKNLMVENLKTENPELYFNYTQWLSDNKCFSNIKITEKDLYSKFKELSRVNYTLFI